MSSTTLLNGGPLPPYNDPPNTCLVCRNYSDIDKFAIDYNLANLNPLLVKWPGTVDPALIDPIATSDKTLQNDIQALKGCGQITMENIKAIVAIRDKILALQNEGEAHLMQATKVFMDSKEVQENQDAEGLRQANIDIALANVNKISQKGEDYKKIIVSLDRVGDAQVRQVAKALYSEALFKGIILPNDVVGMARLFYTWIAYSFRWDQKSKGDVKSGSRVVPPRKVVDMVGHGYEVCELFSNLFVFLFNTILDSNQATIGFGPGLRARLVTGRTKYNARADNPATNGNGHGWVVLPTSSAGSWKPIDCLWGRKENLNENGDVMSVQVKGWWFTRSNSEFLRRHIPDNQDDTLGQPISIADLWKRDLPLNNEDANLYQIDISSMQPYQYIIGPDVKAFSFRRSCPHITKLFNFWLAIVNKSKPADITATQFTFSAANGTWTAAADLSKLLKDGSYVAKVVVPYAVTKGVRVPVEEQPNVKLLKEVQFHEVITWQLGDSKAIDESNLAQFFTQL